MTSGALDFDKSRFVTNSTTLSSSVLSAKAQNVTVDFGEKSPRVVADVELQGELNALLALADMESTTQPLADGSIFGRLKMTQTDGKSRANGQIVIENLVLHDRSLTEPRPANVATLVSSSGDLPPLWRETRLAVTTDVTYDPAADLVRIDSVQADGNQWRLQGRGTVDDLSGQMNTAVEGALECDWDRLLAEHRAEIGEGLKIHGTRKHPFSLRGPLSAPASSGSDMESSLLAQLSGQVQVGWDDADIYGLQAGQAVVTANLSGGVVRVAQLDIPVSEGRLTAAPRMLLLQEPPLFVLPAGPVVQNVQLSPEMCRTWLKYVAPMLADATIVDGRLSMDMKSAKVPVEDWQASQIAGDLAIHSANVRPGPLAQQFLDVAEQVKAIINRKSSGSIVNPNEAWMNIEEQTIVFRMAGGRVYHDSLEISVRDIVIRTRGSVGLDESIALIAEVPIQDAWLKDDRYLAALKGQVIQVPITGTLTKPKVDRNVFQELARQIGTSAGTKLLEGELQNQLQRLFKDK